MTKDQFTEGMTYWDSYKSLLWQALESTTGDVIELGMGDGSTAKLHDYCKEKGRKLWSYENNIEWYKRFEHLRTDWHEIIYSGNNWDVLLESQQENKSPIGVLFSDEAPGGMRKFNISMFCNIAQVIVVHDTEKESDHGYHISWVERLFKYTKVDTTFQTHATAFSNFVDLSKW